MVNIQKAAMIGCGFVGATSAFSLVQSGLFSELVLLDVDQEKAQGEAMDLNHGLPFSRPMKVYAGDYKDLADCFLIIITAGANQRPNETRLQLVNKNVEIFKTIIPNIVRYNKEAILMVVSNPVDILTYVTLRLSGFPSNRVIGSGTVLDTARLKHLLGQHLKVDSRSMHAFVIGEHGDSELAVWSSANVSGIDLNHFCEIQGDHNHTEAMDKLFLDVRDSAYEIINKKGATYYGIAMAVRRITESIVRNEHSILPISSVIKGHYGLDDVCMSVPTIVGGDGVEKVLDIPLDRTEQQLLERSAEALKEVISQIAW
ncbi:MAG: L-lactate dehydrogenase [Clostridiales bacterium]|jgi:L-lactate dehydrogenase|nr:L-lactate dehydrogenase [Clostridiales bacterium]